MYTKTDIIAMISLLATIVIAACGFTLVGLPEATMPNAEYTGSLAGFWSGLFHGMFILIPLTAKLFGFEVGIYEVHNVEIWYDFGFLVGIIFSLLTHRLSAK